MTTSTTAHDLATSLADLLRLVGEGRALDAFARYYADDVAMRENEQPPTIGFDRNLERERAFFASVRSVEEFTVLATGASDQHTFYECLFRWTGTDGKPHRLRQVAIARWRDGRIVDERFVYDTAAAT